MSADPASLDHADPLAHCRARFTLPPDVIYLDGNSLGPVVSAVEARVRATLGEWRDALIRGWNQHGWIDLPERVGNRIAPIIGAAPDTVTVGDTLSLNLVKALAAGLELCPGRRVVLSDSGNFPSDLYMAEGLLRALDKGHELVVVAPEAVGAAIDERVAVVMLTEVDYRTGRLHDLNGLTRRARTAGAVTVWDLAHSAGALPIDLEGAGAELAVGCTYKYLNGGPGAPGFIYVRPDLVDAVQPLLCGWLGHAEPFAFEPAYRPAAGVRRMRVGTPPVLALAALDAALDVFDGVDIRAVRAKSLALGELFIRTLERCGEGLPLELASPRPTAERGSQVSYRCPHAYAVMQALIAAGVVGDFRAPDHLRFGFAPLYLRYAEVAEAAERLAEVLRERRWDRPEFQRRAKVT